MELWRGVGPLRVNLCLWIREMRCFTQLFSEYQFLTHAGGWSSLTHPKKGNPWVRTFNTAYFVLFDPLPKWYHHVQSRNFWLVLLMVCVFLWLPSPPVRVSRGWQCTGHLACALGCQGINGSLFWRRVWDSIALLQWTDSWLWLLLTGFMGSRHIPSVTKCGGRAQETRMSHIWSKQEIVATTASAAPAEEDEQPVQGAVLVPSSNAFFSFFCMCCIRGAACLRNEASTLLCLTAPPCLFVVLLSCWVIDIKLSHLFLNKYHFFLLHQSSSLRAWGWGRAEDSGGYIENEFFALDTILSAGLCIQPYKKLGEYLPSLWKWSDAGCVSDILVNMCHWNQLGGMTAHLNREGRACGHRGCLVSRTYRLTVNLASLRIHELSDCEISCFPILWPGCGCAGEVHAQHAKERPWLGGKFCGLPLRDEVLPFSFSDDQSWLRPHLSLLLQQKENENKVPSKDYLCPGLQSPVFQCVSTRCEWEDICGCANLLDTNSPPFSL